MYGCNAEKYVTDLDSRSAKHSPLQCYGLVQNTNCIVKVSFLHVCGTNWPNRATMRFKSLSTDVCIVPHRVIHLPSFTHDVPDVVKRVTPIEV